MPARELGSSYDSPHRAHGVGSTLLKRHKILPHPREPAYHPSTLTTRPRNLSIDTGTSSLAGSDTSSPRILKHTSKRIGSLVLPPTPPTHSRQSSGSRPAPAPAPIFDIASLQTKEDFPSTPTTPVNQQQSPPTPDVTPPRAMPLVFRPHISDRYPASRTDSFKTARENPYSSDEDEASTVRPGIPSTRTSAFEVPQAVQKAQKRREIGLGLGLESDNGGKSTPRARVVSQEEFVVLDGEWGAPSDEVSEVEREWDGNLMRDVTVRKRPGRNIQRLDLHRDGATDEVIEDDIVFPTSATRIPRSLPLQERITTHRLARESADRTSVEEFAKHIAWPAAVADPESPSTPDVRRFSAMSGRSVSSTVVEALVVDAAPARRKTLRHTKKYFGLRDFSSDQSTRRPALYSIVSSEPQHRVHHTAARIPEQGHQSLASNTTVGTTSSSGKSRKEIVRSGGIPVVIVPERRSSSKSRPPSLRSTSSKKTKRSLSLNSAPLSQSSKYNEPGCIQSRPTRPRTMSESAGSGHDSVRTIDNPPSIPARRSSLSAPTSRNTSRTGSLTAESLNAHNMILKNKQEEIIPTEEPPQPHAEAERDVDTHTHHRLNVDHNGDPFFGKRLSTQVTPFSQTSYDTAGTAAEVSEALAVTIFPHQNRSVLVVEHKTSEESSPTSLRPVDTSRLQPSMTFNGNVTTGPVTPPQPSHPMDAVDSPLRNPRNPPEPPAIKFIPPTPAALTPSQEEDRQLGFGIDDEPVSTDNKPKRSMSMMRRAFSNRRYSESLAQAPSLLKRTFSLSGGRRRDLADGSSQISKDQDNLSALYPSVPDRPADAGKLHPFWRPAYFWDDLDGRDDLEDYEYGYPPIDNRPAPPKRTLSQKLKRTFAILPIDDELYDHQAYSRDRRIMQRTASGNMRVVKKRSTASLRREGGDRRTYSEDRRPVSGPAKGTFGYGFKDGNGGRVATIPGLGLRVEYVGWSGVKNKLSERRREQRSQKLRASISGPKSVQSGMDDVLRRRN
ncbi:uncharacterized protein RSE6_04255 [Rhynchosporium secalis]|uniref:Uncharacterized protein n=1 Tax=Rhynchosporium secalis TaxID=38038 RepID=A0A1E1M4U9_RHYSE|nr:uncharacterized protein RSE6_04255 [Rhynchosporium secalis]